jgi:hypothetical protein
MQETTHPWHRRSLRLQGYDYRQSGAYFLTICAHQRACLFGEIVRDVMHENKAGQAVREAWEWLPARFPDVELDAFAVMPNHLHGILFIGDDHGHLGRVVGAFKSLPCTAITKESRVKGGRVTTGSRGSGTTTSMSSAMRNP